MTRGSKSVDRWLLRRGAAPRADRVIVGLLVVAVMVGGCTPGPPQEKAPPAAKEGTKPPKAAVSGAVGEALAEFNGGAALLEQYKYAEAIQAFDNVLKIAPDWIAARFNLGLAHFNLQGTRGGQDHLEAARHSFEKVLAVAPDHLHARFCLGLYYQHQGNNAEALKHFQAVYQKDPEDPYVGYKYAEALTDLDRSEESAKVLEKVVALDPGFVSGMYRLAGVYRRLRQLDKAKPLLDRFEELDAVGLDKGPFKVDIVYGAAGKYYLALGADNLPLPPPKATPAPRIIFSPEPKPLAARPVAWKWPGGSVGLPGIAAGDLDGDGDLDLCLAGLDPQGGTSVWLNGGSGGFAPGPVLTDKGVSPCLGDVDNDGDLDLWLGRAGSDLLLQNDGAGDFYWNLPIGVLSRLRGSAESGDGADPNRAALAAPGDGGLLTSCARLVDVDSDGDLDFLAFRLAEGSVPAAGDLKPAPTSIYNNNRDGTFTDIAARLGLVFAETPVAAFVADDFDGDRDTDLVIFPAGEAEPIGWLNDRAWQYRMLDAKTLGLATKGVLSATTGDPDKDGDRDLLVFAEDGVQLYVNRGKFQFELHQGFSEGCGRLGGTGGQFADMDNDGDLDLVIPDAHRPDGTRGPVLLVNDWPQDRFLNVIQLDPGNLLAALETKGDASCVVADFTGNGRCDVLLVPAGETPLLVENVTPGGHWVAIDLRGARGRDKKSRSNNSAIGARVEVKTGRVFQQFVVGAPSGPVASPPHRIHAGLGSHTKVDWLRIIWPDGVLQAEIELPADQVATITEIQRKISSCPHLFAWDGSRYEFVSDFGGMGGLGYFLAPGTYARPDPTEYVPIPRLEPQQGQYVLQVLEPLEEVVYFDEAKLIAVDHPPGTEVYPNEMMAVSVPPPAFEVFCFERPIEPVGASDHRGVDVTDALRRIDRRYAGATEPDHRFEGFAEDHFVELDFGDHLEDLSSDRRLILCLHGSVEYAYSSTHFAARQAGLRLKPPSIHVLRDGHWVELFREVGYPAGLQHMMTLDVTGKILPGDQKVRISTNMEISWDRIFLAQHLADAAVSLREAPVESADLHFFGYPREYSPDGRRPNLYDYGNVDPTAAWRLMDGQYTRYGEVAQLLAEADDCYVIMGRGEELTLRFPAGAFGPVPQGCRRTFLLKTDSFCKDMDLYTAHPDTVGPLPFHAMSGYPYGPDERYPDDEKTRQHRAEFNTRQIRTR